MNILNRSILASLTLCAVAFAQSATAEDQVKSDSTINSIQQPVLVKPIGTTADSKTPPTKNKVNSTPTANSKGKMCLSPIGTWVSCK